MRKWIPRLIAPVLLAALLAAACGGDEEETTSSEDSSAEVKMGLDDFFFEPEEVSAAAGQSIKFELENEGQARHTFTIAELAVDQVLDAGQRVTATVTPDQSGDIVFYCRFHRSQGMEGVLKVSGGLGGAGATPTAGAGGYGYGTGY